MKDKNNRLRASGGRMLGGDGTARQARPGPSELRTDPRPGFECARGGRFEGRVKIPKLFRVYLRHGALVCSPPVIDRRFKTNDYLVICDVTRLDEKRFKIFFG